MNRPAPLTREQLFLSFGVQVSALHAAGVGLEELREALVYLLECWPDLVQVSKQAEELRREHKPPRPG